MVVRFHNIWGLRFKTVSETDIKVLDQTKYKPFVVVDPLSCDVHYEFQEVNFLDLRMPPLNNDEIVLMKQFQYHSFKGKSALTLPLKFDPLSKDEIIKRYIQESHNIFQISLLRSRIVRERISLCVDNPKQTYLILNPLTIEIRDYSRHRVDIFYVKELEHVFQLNMDNKIRSLYSVFLPDFNSVMVHSSAVVHYGKTALFIAPGGGGKSTVAKLSRNGEILSDDQNILRINQDKITVYSTPWGRISNGSKHAPLGGIFLLEKASFFEIEAIKPREVIQHLLENNPNLWIFLPNDRKIRVLDIVSEICHRVPVYRLRFTKSFINWEAISNSMVD